MATTANALQFGEQGVFSTADRQAPPLLTVNPSALWFNQLQASSIVNRSQTPLGTTPNGIPLRGLQVPQGQSLVLAGGAINFEGGGVNALGGRIDLAAIASPNRAGVPNIVGLATDGNEIKLNVPTEARGDVTFTNGAIANVASGNGGAIVVSARNLTLINARLRAGIEENAGAIDSQAGDIVLNVTEQVLAQQSVLANIVRSGGLGNAGNLQIQTGSLLLSRGTQLFTDTSGTGNAGNIVVEARDRIVLQGADSDEFLSLMNSGIKEGGRGNGGNIRLTTDSLSLTQGTQLISSVSGQGNGGDVILKARDITFLGSAPDGNGGFNPSGIFAAVEAKGQGNAGQIRINTQTLTIADGASINSFTRGQGNAGNIVIEAQRSRQFGECDGGLTVPLRRRGVGQGATLLFGRRFCR
ncbi:MAG: hypothetical protein HC936_19055 [Leptolyngbyaceae cyanobacterium SU_3_3]|nr:hypothetical protein [Leptolyngbyaceae cyanobacterium SU_3_3]